MADVNADDSQTPPDMKEPSSADPSIYGCSHYRRKCAFMSPCCGKTYTCRLCHNENETHEIDRRAVMQVVCLVCDTKQLFGSHCVSCNVKFGQYFCSICRLYDDTDKGQFHCEPCGICRVGGRENFFHCTKCDMCLGVQLEPSHKCVEKVAHCNCPVCLEDLHTSTSNLSVLKCGHITHAKCQEDLLKSGNYTCPVCCHSIGDMSSVWQELDADIAATQMPEEYRDKTLWILCRDCHENSQVLFHVLGLKCQHCGSYNTCNDAEPTGDAAAAAAAAAASNNDANSPPHSSDPHTNSHPTATDDAAAAVAIGNGDVISTSDRPDHPVDDCV